MTKRKYVKIGENAVAYECTNPKCKWQGSDKEWVQKNIDPEFPSTTSSTCPNCGNDEFYGLLNVPPNQNNKRRFQTN